MPDLATLAALQDLSVAAVAAGWLLGACAAGRTRTGRAFLGLAAITFAALLFVTPYTWAPFLFMLATGLLYLRRRPRPLMAAAVLGVSAMASDTLLQLGGPVLVAIGMSAVIVHDLWMTQPPASPGSPLWTDTRRRSPVMRLGGILFLTTMLLIAGMFLPGVDPELWTDVLLEPLSVINLAFAAALSMRLSWMSENSRLWRVLAVAFILASLDDLLDVHDLVHAAFISAMGTAAGREVWIGDDDVVVVAYTLAFALVAGWTFRRDLLVRPWTTALFVLAGVLIAAMAVCDSFDAWFHCLEGPCEAGATALLLAGLVVEVQRLSAADRRQPAPALPT